MNLIPCAHAHQGFHKAASRPNKINILHSQIHSFPKSYLYAAGLLHVGRKSDKNFAELLQSEHINTPERLMWLTPDHLSKLGLTLGQIKDFTDLQNCCKHVSVEKDPEPGSVQVCIRFVSVLCNVISIPRDGFHHAPCRLGMGRRTRRAESPQHVMP